MPTRQALDLAQAAGLDLVLVAEKAEPPVAKIVNYGKHKYDQDKFKREHKKKTQDVKGIKISPNIAENDLNTLARRALKFLEDGDKVRIVCRFKQRELAHPEVGARKIESFCVMVDEFGKKEKDPVLSGREMTCVINPKLIGSQKKNAKAEDQQDSSEEV